MNEKMLEMHQKISNDRKPFNQTQNNVRTTAVHTV